MDDPQQLEIEEKFGCLYDDDSEDLESLKNPSYPLDLDSLETYFPTSKNKFDESYKDVDLHFSNYVGATEQNLPFKIAKVAQWSNLTFDYQKHLLEHNFVKALKIQVHAWPYIFRGQQSVLIVSPPATGKTCAYLVPIIGTVLRGKDPSRRDSWLSTPSFVIISSSPFKAEKIASQANNLLSHRKDVNILLVSCSTKLKTKETESSLNRHVDILITTPGTILEMSNNGSFAFDEVSYLIFDDADESFSLYKNECAEIHSRYGLYWSNKYISRAKQVNAKVNEETVKKAVKTIIVSELYTKEIAEYYDQTKQLDCSILLFGDLFELSMKLQFPIRLEYARDFDCQIHFLLQSIKENSNEAPFSRIIVCCSSDEETKSVADRLEQEDKMTPIKNKMAVMRFSLAAHKDKHDSILRHWKALENHKGVLIISDNYLKHLKISDCEIIFHFSMPPTKQEFISRYNLMSQYLNTKSKRFISVTKNPQSILLFTPSRKALARDFLRLYKRIGKKPHEELLNDIESQGKNYCDQYVAFGKCLHSLCVKDHELGGSSSNLLGIPSSGQIKFEICSTVTANHLMIKPLAYRDASQSNGEWVHFPDASELIKDELDEIVRNKEPSYSGQVKVGQLFLAVNITGRHRVRIERISKDTAFKACEIDTGKIVYVQKYELRQLSEYAKSIPPQVISCYITGIEPVHGSTSWSVYAQEAVKFWMKTEQLVLATAWIHLSLNDQIWIHDVSLFSRSSNYSLGTIESLLIDEKFAVKCSKIKHSKANDESLKEKAILMWNSALIESSQSWAFLPHDGPEVVYLTIFKSFDKFYLQRAQFEKQLKTLEREMCMQQFKPLNEVIPGLVCACKYEFDGEVVLNRCQVLNVRNVDDAGDHHPKTTKVDVFCLDYGDTMTVEIGQLCRIMPQHVEQLPYQAIECSMDPIENFKLPMEDVKFQIYELARRGDGWNADLICKTISSTKDTKDDRKIFKVKLFVSANETEEASFFHSFETKLSSAVEPIGDEVISLPKHQVNEEDEKEDELKERNEDPIDKAKAEFIAAASESLDDFCRSIAPTENINRISNVDFVNGLNSNLNAIDEELFDEDPEVDQMNEEIELHLRRYHQQLLDEEGQLPERLYMDDPNLENY